MLRSQKSEKQLIKRYLIKRDKYFGKIKKHCIYCHIRKSRLMRQFKEVRYLNSVLTSKCKCQEESKCISNEELNTINVIDNDDVSLTLNLDKTEINDNFSTNISLKQEAEFGEINNLTKDLNPAIKSNHKFTINIPQPLKSRKNNTKKTLKANCTCLKSGLKPEVSPTKYQTKSKENDNLTVSWEKCTTQIYNKGFRKEMLYSIMADNSVSNAQHREKLTCKTCFQKSTSFTKNDVAKYVEATLLDSKILKEIIPIELKYENKNYKVRVLLDSPKSNMTQFIKNHFCIKLDFNSSFISSIKTEEAPIPKSKKKAISLKKSATKKKKRIRIKSAVSSSVPMLLSSGDSLFPYAQKIASQASAAVNVCLGSLNGGNTAESSTNGIKTYSLSQNNDCSAVLFNEAEQLFIFNDDCSIHSINANKIVKLNKKKCFTHGESKVQTSKIDKKLECICLIESPVQMHTPRSIPLKIFNTTEKNINKAEGDLQMPPVDHCTSMVAASSQLSLESSISTSHLGIICYLCGNLYSSYSIHIHYYTCRRRWERAARILGRGVKIPDMPDPSPKELEIRVAEHNQQNQSAANKYRASVALLASFSGLEPSSINGVLYTLHDAFNDAMLEVSKINEMRYKRLIVS